MRGVDEEDFHPIWEKLMWTYNTELNYVEITLDEDDNLAITDTSYWKSQNRVVASQRYDKYFKKQSWKQNF